jgi:hypothetical protein
MATPVMITSLEGDKSNHHSVAIVTMEVLCHLLFCFMQAAPAATPLMISSRSRRSNEHHGARQPVAAGSEAVAEHHQQQQVMLLQRCSRLSDAAGAR